MDVIKVSNLVKSYNRKRVVDGVNLEIKQGEIFGIIGPNGAGKTTTLECIEGLNIPDAGSEIQVLGLNPQKDRKKLYLQIGVQLQEGSYPQFSKVKDIVKTMEVFYRKTRSYKELLGEFDLLEKEDFYITNLSGGQKQRLSIALALMNNPKIVFLDEVTTGLDPEARREMWKWILKLKGNGITVVLTTHYMEEAQAVCDRVAFFKNGQIIALDTPNGIIEKCNLLEKIEVKLSSEEEVAKLKNLIEFEISVGKDLNVTILGDSEMSSKVIEVIVKEKIVYSDLKVIKPNLEDAYLYLAKAI